MAATQNASGLRQTINHQNVGSNDQISMPPPPVPHRSLNRQVVLDEDDYTTALSHIIARDFFPSLVHLEANNSYLDALNSDDPQRIDESVRRLSALQATPTPFPTTVANTPYGGAVTDTPKYERAAKRRKYNNDLSLDEFQAKYTSEDNSSFTEILEEENTLRRDKWRWAWEAQQRVSDLKTKQLQAKEEVLLIESSAAPGVREKLAIEPPRPDKLITAGGELTDEESLDTEEESKEGYIISTAVALTKYGDSEQTGVNVLAKKKDSREAGVEAWSFKARNCLMFPPDADQSPYDVSTDLSSDFRVIKHSNTRLPDQEQGDRGSTEPPTPSRSVIGAAIDGTSYLRTPKIGGFSLVPNLPSPTAAQLGKVGMKQLMTHGQIASTPRILSSTDGLNDVPSTPFHIANPSQREVVAQKLSTKASRSLKAQASLMKGGGSRPNKSSALPSTPRHMSGNLTPAARRLLDRTVGSTVAAGRRADAMSRLAAWDNQPQRERPLSQVTWTPTPKRTM